MIYEETFDGRGNGWIGWGGAGVGAVALEKVEGAVVSRSPWWIDPNHAPPGAGYLHLHYCLHTTVHKNTPLYEELSGPNRFINGGYPRDFRNAKVTLRTRGRINEHGSNLVLLVQGDVGPKRINHVLTGQPIDIYEDWHEQTLHLVPDDDQWTCLGSCKDRLDLYGVGPIEPLLADVNVDIILVHFPLNVQPLGEVNGDRYTLHPGTHYDVDTSRLPSGELYLDSIRIEFAEQDS